MDTGGGVFVLDGARITDDAGFGVLTVAGVIQKSSNIGATKIAMQLRPEEMWNMYTSIGLGQAPKVGFPGAVDRAPAAVEKLAPHRTGDDVVWLRPVGVAVPACARLHELLPATGMFCRVSIFRTPGEQPVQGPQVFAPTTAREVRAMLETVTGAGRHVARCGGAGLSRRRQERHRVQARGPRLRPIEIPRVVRRHGADAESAHRRRGDRSMSRRSAATSAAGVAGRCSRRIAGDTLRALNVPPDMPVKQMVVNDESGAASQPAATAPTQNAQSTAKKLAVSSNNKTHPGVVR